MKRRELREQGDDENRLLSSEMKKASEEALMGCGGVQCRPPVLRLAGKSVLGTISRPIRLLVDVVGLGKSVSAGALMWKLGLPTDAERTAA